MKKITFIIAIILGIYLNVNAQNKDLPYSPIRFYIGISMGEDHDRYELHKNNGNTLFLDDFRNRTEIQVDEVEKFKINGVTKKKYTSLYKVDIHMYETDYEGGLTKKSNVIYSSYAHFRYSKKYKDNRITFEDDHDFDYITISDRNKKWYWRKEHITYAKKFNQDKYIFMILPNFIYSSYNNSYYCYQIYAVLIKNDEGKYIANTFYPKNKYNKDFNAINDVNFKKIKNEIKISCSFKNNDDDVIFKINDDKVNYIGHQNLKKFNN